MNKLIMDCRTALQTLLDHIDYTEGACRTNEAVGAVLPFTVILMCKEAIRESQSPEEREYLCGN